MEALMGSTAHLTIINKTKYVMKRFQCHSYQMNSWEFPERVEAGQKARFKVEWCENIFKTKSDDAGSAYYELEGHSSQRIEFAMWNAKQYNFTLKQIGFPGIDPDAKRINWIDDGEIILEILDEGVNPRQWMKQIDDDTPINKLSIPGTHDSLTYYLSTIGSLLKRFTQTQEVNIVTQLNYGFRYLDIRIDKNLQGCHGSFGCKNTLWEVMAWVKDFLATNKDETIVMRIKYDGGENNTDYQNNIKRLFNDYCGILWKNNLSSGFPLLKDVRGKVVVLDSLDGNYIKKKGYGYIFNEDGKFDTQDDFSGPDQDKKQQKIRDYIDLPYNTQKMKINHVSATGKTAGFFGWSPRDYAEYENPRTIKYLVEKNSKVITGLLIFDFVDESISQVVMLENEFKK